MSARSGSLGWVVVAGAISLTIAGAMWGLLDSQFIDVVAGTDIWQAPADSILHQGRSYVIATWDWLLLIVVLRIGIEALVASRLYGAATSLPFATLILFVVHLLIVLWMLTIPEMGAPMYERAVNSSEVAQAGYDTGVKLAWDWGIGVIPAVLVLVTDVWYLSAPIRNDMLRR